MEGRQWLPRTEQRQQMAKNLVIVESPAKAKTIGKYLGNDYVVEASIGHIMDLPKNDIGVELKRRTFEPTLIVSPGKEKVVDRLKKLAAKSDSVFPARDLQRDYEEGRAAGISAYARCRRKLSGCAADTQGFGPAGGISDLAAAM